MLTKCVNHPKYDNSCFYCQLIKLTEMFDSCEKAITTVFLIYIYIYIYIYVQAIYGYYFICLPFRVSSIWWGIMLCGS